MNSSCGSETDHAHFAANTCKIEFLLFSLVAEPCPHVLLFLHRQNLIVLVALSAAHFFYARHVKSLII
jgi:hypothetical protein